MPSVSFAGMNGLALTQFAVGRREWKGCEGGIVDVEVGHSSDRRAQPANGASIRNSATVLPVTMSRVA